MLTEPVRKGARPHLGRPAVPLLALLAVVAGGCAQVGTNTFTFWDAFWSMIVFFFWFMFIWIFISLFGDIIRRNDLSGWAKGGWMLLLVILPFLGALIYVVARPKVTTQDVQIMAQQDAALHAAASVSTADELAKLAQLKQAGAITEPEYQTLKQKTLQGSQV